MWLHNKIPPELIFLCNVLCNAGSVPGSGKGLCQFPPWGGGWAGGGAQKARGQTRGAEKGRKRAKQARNKLLGNKLWGTSSGGTSWGTSFGGHKHLHKHLGGHLWEGGGGSLKGCFWPRFSPGASPANFGKKGFFGAIFAKIGFFASRGKSGPKKAYPSLCFSLAWAWEFSSQWYT